VAAVSNRHARSFEETERPGFKFRNAALRKVICGEVDGTHGAVGVHLIEGGM
jgi:hypothetical protein